MKKNYLFRLIIALFALAVLGTVLPLNSSIFAQTAQVAGSPQEAARLANEAYQAYQKQDFTTAISKCNQAIRYSPTYPYAYYLKGASQFELSQFNESAESLTTALSQGYTPAKDVYIQRWKVNYNLGKFSAVEADLREIVRLSPKDLETRLILTDILRTNKKYAEAVKMGEEAQALDPKNGDPHFYLALVYNEQRDYRTAVAEALQAVQLKSKLAPNAKSLIAGDLFLVKRYDEAIALYQEAMKEKPDLLEAYWGMSSAYQAQNKFAESIAALEKAVAVKPQDGSTYVNLSFAYSLGGNDQKAAEAGKLAIQYLPQDHMGYTNLCRANNGLKQYDAAIKVCNQALQISPNDGETFLYLGNAYKFKNDAAKARQYYEKAAVGLQTFTRETPDYADGHYLLGNAYFETEQWGKAIVAYQKAIEINENFVKAHLNLGYTYIKINDLRSAREEYNKLKPLDSQRAAQLLSGIQAQSKSKN